MIDINEQFNEFYFSKMESATNDDVSPDYREHSEKESKLFYEIKDLLPPEKKKLMFELDSIMGAIASDYQGFGYRTGFSDGIKLLIKALMGEL